MEPRRLQASVVAVDALAAREIDEMFDVYVRLYERVTEDAFLRDLAEKQWVLLLRDAGVVRGFTTILLMDLESRGESLRVVFSGDTGIEPGFWGGQDLVRAWASFMGEVLAHEPGRRLYWFLISKGYRTYLYLPLFFHTFYPRADVPTPIFERDLIDTLGAAKFPGDFNPRTGVVEFAESHGQLKPRLADTPRHRKEHPHVRFFLEKNPRYADGHELVCVAEISPDNMKGLARRMLLEGAGALATA